MGSGFGAGRANNGGIDCRDGARRDGAGIDWIGGVVDRNTICEFLTAFKLASSISEP
jgi:hypothetical protein